MTARDAVLGGDVDAVAEREERVGRHRGAGDRRAPRRAAFIAAIARRVDAAHLAGADADRRAVARDRRWRSTSRTCDPPGEQQVVELGSASAARFVTTLQVGRRDHAGVAALHEQAAGDAAVLERARRSGRRGSPVLEQAHVLLARRSARAPRRSKPGRDDHLDELPADDRRGRCAVELAVEGDDAAEGRGRIGAAGALVGARAACRRPRRRRGWRA